MKSFRLARILLVDDNEAGRYVKARILQQAGCVVVEAANGSSGIDIARHEADFDTVILDVHLPDMLGFEVCRHIKALRPEVPILMTSATFVADKDRSFGLDEGADAYLTEPIEKPVFLSQVRALLRLRIAERRQRESEERLQLALEVSQGASWYWDLATGELDVSNSFRPLYGMKSHDLVTFGRWIDCIAAEDRERVREACEEVLASGRECAIEFRILHPERGERWLMGRGRVERDPDGKAVRFVGINRDVTDRKQNEKHIELLMREMSHRSKNVLALVQAIARQTAAGNPAEFSQRFSERLQALSASQDLLVNGSWRGVHLDALAQSQLAHFADLIGSRITLAGPQLAVPAQVAQSIGMALHELATNAGKYGALSNHTGLIEIRWALTNGGRDFEMTWSESGGPQVAAPQRRGFGSNVIERMTRMSLGATTALSFPETGLQWRLVCPAANVVEGSGMPADILVANAHANGDRKRILLVEDEPLVALDLATLLEEADFSIVGPVKSVDEAFAQIERTGCDAAVLDINLGDETSERFARALMEHDIPFVVVSGYPNGQISGTYGGAPRIPKPVSPRRLVAELRRCLERKLEVAAHTTPDLQPPAG